MSYDGPERQTLTSPPAVVNIADVVPVVIQVKASDLRKGDVVFDAFGGQHKLADVKHLQAPRYIVSIKRADLPYREWFGTANDFTIIREMPKAPVDPTVSEHGDALAPGQRNPYNRATGLFIARCKCGAEFEASEPFAADILMMEHAQQATEFGTNTERHDHGKEA